MNILGIDPGSRKIGYAIIEIIDNKHKILTAGYIENKKDTLYDGLKYILNEFDEIFLTWNIDEVAIENIFYAYNPKTVILLAQFRGAICSNVLRYKNIFYEYTALQVKKSLTGNGKSTKEQVNYIIRKIFNIQKEIKVLDITDAIAIAFTHAQRVKIRQ